MPNSLTPSIVTPGIDIASLPAATAARLLGLEAPSPGTARLIGLPKAMTGPPALSVAITSQIAGSTLVGVTLDGVHINAAAPFRYACARMALNGGGYPDNLFVASANCSEYSLTNPVAAVESGSYAVDFETDTDSFEVLCKGTAGPIRIMVDQFDGQGFQYATSQAPGWAASTAYTTSSGTTVRSQVRPTTATGSIYECLTAGTSGGVEPIWPARAGYKVADGTAVWVNIGKSAGYHFTKADGSFYYLLVNFGNRAFRRVRLEAPGNTVFGGIQIDPKSSIWASTLPVGPNVIVLGDSFTEGTGGNAATGWYGDTLGKALGWWNIRQSGEGGTGYLATNPGAFNRPNFRPRLQLDVISQTPDIVIVAGGINDANSFTPAAIQVEATLLFQQIRNGLPNCRLIVLGPWWTGGSPPQAVINCRDALFAAAQGYASLTIDTIGGPVPYDGNPAHYVDTGWMTGTYNTTTPGLATKAAFWYQGGVDSTDPTHPSPEGHVYYGHRLAAAIAAAMPF